MFHVAFDRVEQVGDQVGAALELDIDAAPALFDHVLVLDQLVVDHDTVADDCSNDGQYYAHGHENTPLVGPPIPLRVA